MALDVGEVARNASDVIRKLEDPMDGVYALFGLITLRLEDQHLDLNSWPMEARWEKIEDAEDKENAVQRAVSALEDSPDTESLGRSLEALGLGDPSELTVFRSSHGKTLFPELTSFVERTDVSELTPKQLSRLSDELLFTAGDMGRSGEFFTPSSLSKLIAEILHPSPEDSIYDPTAGSGGLLLSVQRRAAQNGEESPQIHGQEINRKVAAVARINARLHGVRADIRVGDTLTDPRHTSGESLQTFDVVAANPPMGLRRESVEEISETVPDRFQFGPVVGRRLDTAFLQHGLSSLEEGGKAAFIMAPRILRPSHSEREIVRELLSKDLIQTIVKLPKGLLPNTSIPPVLAIFNRSKPEGRKGRVLLVDASDEHAGRRTDVELKRHHREKIAGIVNHSSEKESFSIDVRAEKILQNECNLSPARYILDRDITEYLSGFVDWKNLRDVANVDSGQYVETNGEGDVPILMPTDVSQPEAFEEFSQYAPSGEVDGLPEMEPGDLVLARTRPHDISEISEDRSGARCGHHVVRIRVDEAAEGLKTFLLDFLSSDAGSRLLESRSLGANGSLPASDIRELPVPVPGPDVASVVNKVHDLESELTSQIEKVAKLRDELFSLKGEESDNSRSIRQLSATAEVLSSSLLRSDDLDYRVRNFYPFPLAYTYRNLKAISEPAQQHEEILRIVENVVSFLACVGLSVGRCEGLIPRPNHSDLAQEALKDAWRGGIALGTWKTLAHAVATELQGEAETDLAGDYASIWFSGGGQSDLDACIDELIETRNDARHGRGPTTQAEYEEEVEGLHRRLQTVYEEIEFFVGYPLHLVRNLNSPWDGTGFEVESLTYVGDHPGMDPKVSHIEHPVAQNLLYIESGSHEWVPLHPVISVHHCPKCKRRETYVLDKWVGEESFGLKSFERGHGIKAEQAAIDIGSHAARFFAGD